MPAIAVPGTLALGLTRNSSSVSALQVTPYFFMFSLGPKRLGVVPALRPTTPTRLGPTFALSSFVTPWQAGQPLASNSCLPLTASPLTSLAYAAGVAKRAATANKRMRRIADIALSSPEIKNPCRDDSSKPSPGLPQDVQIGR